MSFYESAKDLPDFDDYVMAGCSDRYFAVTPVYPFGYGLSDTSYAYGGLSIHSAEGKPGMGLHVVVTVRNTGVRDGSEVAELYVTHPVFTGAAPLARRGLQRLALRPGESRRLVFDLLPRELSFVDRDGHRRVLAGTYGLSIGPAGRKCRVGFGALRGVIGRTDSGMIRQSTVGETHV